MCSGTESPVLAFTMIQEELKALGKEIYVDHVFSAEIDPQKQSYISNNFPSSIIFRDIVEMAKANGTDKTATTVYGSCKKIPGDITMLIAGSSCVDFSMLNPNRKNLDDLGESGDTLKGIMDYAKVYRPLIVILENVESAPWEEIRAGWANDQNFLTEQKIPEQHWFRNFWGDEPAYAATYTIADTKDYYIPQTRHRGYLVAVDLKRCQELGLSEEDAEDLTKFWEFVFQEHAIAASSPLDEFILDSDDPRVLQDKEQRGRIKKKSMEGHQWHLTQGRHDDLRETMGLGNKRPITTRTGDFSKAPDWWQQTYVRVSVERVKQTFDMNFLRQVKRHGYDGLYKCRLWDISQSIDRNTDSHPFGIANCITPRGMPFLPYQGRPLTGPEQLLLQGLPIDQLQLTRLTPTQLTDLAGNAMTTTVVGASIISACIVFAPQIANVTKARDSSKAPKKEPPTTKLDHTSLGPSQDIKFAPTQYHRIKDLVEIALLTVSLCAQCENRSGVTVQAIVVCQKCEHTVCADCAGNPKHDYVPIDSDHNQLGRLPPFFFRSMIKDALPMQLKLSGLSDEHFRALKMGAESCLKVDDAVLFTKYANMALGRTLRYRSSTRSHRWTMIYESNENKGPSSRLELVLSHGTVQWLLYIIPEKTINGNSPIRRLYSTPIARMCPSNNNLLLGRWELCVPNVKEFNIEIEGEGKLLSAWKAKLGLRGFEDQQVWSTLRIRGVPGQQIDTERIIEGIYDLLPDCGMASSSLHKRRTTWFLDEALLLSRHRENEALMSFDEKFRALAQIAGLDLSDGCSVEEADHINDTAEATASDLRTFIDNVPESEHESPTYLFLDPERTGFDPEDRFTFSTYKYRLNYNETRYSMARIEPGWRQSETQNSVVTCTTYGDWMSCEAFLSVVEPQNAVSSVIKSSPEVSIYNYKPYSEENDDEEQDPDTEYLCIEDSQDAFIFEHAMKKRARVFTLLTRREGPHSGYVEVGLNIPALAHRAWGHIQPQRPTRDIQTSQPTQVMEVSWRLDTKFHWPTSINLPPFKICSSKHNEPLSITFPGESSPGTPYMLRLDQQRSVSWMVDQEDPDKVGPFWRQEIAEDYVLSFNYRAEARLQMRQIILGGVLADEVGFGKTPSLLALIHHQNQNPPKTSEENKSHRPGYIRLKATMILVPHNIFPQWRQEMKKFYAKRYNILSLANFKALQDTTVLQFKQADIVLVSTHLLTQSQYWENVGIFASMPKLESTKGRSFAAWLHHAGLRSCERVQEGERSMTSLLETLRDKQLHMGRDELFQHDRPTQRQTGARREKEFNRVPKMRQYPSKSLDQFNVKSIDDLKGPNLHIFRFERMIIDEFEYLSDQAHHYLSDSLVADKRWIVSATPRIDNFHYVRKMFRLINVNIGIEDDAPGVVDANTLAAMRKLMTSVERFWSYNQTHSLYWHRERQNHAQRAIDNFVRQNIAEEKVVDVEEEVQPVTLSCPEYLNYKRHEGLIRSNNGRVQYVGNNTFESNLTRIANRDLAGSKTGAEALVKAASIYFSRKDLTASGRDVQEQKGLIDRRSFEYEQALRLLRDLFRKATWLQSRLQAINGRQYRDVHYEKFKRNLKSGAFGDEDCTSVILRLINKVESQRDSIRESEFFHHISLKRELKAEEQKLIDWTKAKRMDRLEAHAGSLKDQKDIIKNKIAGKPLTASPQPGIKDPPTCKTAIPNLRDHKELTEELRAMMTSLHASSTELVFRTRQWRFDKAASKLQHWLLNKDAAFMPVCPIPGHTEHNDPDNVLLNNSCGHMACPDCIGAEEVCPHKGCNAFAEDFHLNKPNDLTAGGHETKYGSKLDGLVELIKSLPADEKVLIFVQFEIIMQRVETVLDVVGVDNWALREVATPPQINHMTKSFQDGERKVLILNSSNETAAGLNLHIAQHVIFISPFVAQGNHQYQASMTQCVGRAVRTGQTKTVKVYRFITLKTIDVDLIDQQESRRLSMPEATGEWKLATEGEMDEDDWEAGGALMTGYVQPESED
ncbi:hypothetical protein P7C71_g5647, partial [Lecanoromycetidae sp. Uapishka_2]